MKTDLSHLNRYLCEGNGPGDDGGLWEIPHFGVTIRVIASWGYGWDHVSVSLPNRCPVWDEMCAIKDLFFEAEETVIQYHPPKDRYCNDHAYCLHLWRPQDIELPAPPLWMVGIGIK